MGDEFRTRNMSTSFWILKKRLSFHYENDRGEHRYKKGWENEKRITNAIEVETNEKFN